LWAAGLVVAAAACLVLTVGPEVVQRRSVVSVAVPFWDSTTALAMVRRHASDLDEVTLWSYEVAAQGQVVRQPFAADGTTVIPALRAQGLRVLGVIADTVKGRWDPAVVRRLLADPKLRRSHREAVVSFVLDQGLDGVQLDYENLTESDRTGFSALVTDLAQDLHRHGRLLSVAVHPKIEDRGYDARNLAQDYAEVGRWADEVVVMAYDWHWPGGDSGPIAPRLWVDQVLSYSMQHVPASKILLGVAQFGYDWSGVGTDILQWRDVDDRRRRFEARVERDPVSGCPHFTYLSQGNLHEVWFEDSRSLQQKLDLASRHRVAGVAVWRLGGVDPRIWQALGRTWVTSGRSS
jgi:spore germination protein